MYSRSDSAGSTPKEIRYKIIDAVNILKWKTKEPLPVFMLTFDRTEKIDKIYEITDTRGMRVEINTYRKTKILPLCKTCQSWGNSKSCCHKEPRYVKCAWKHSTVQCKKPKEAQTKCYNCGEDHPSNYRGCIVAKKHSNYPKYSNKTDESIKTKV